MRVPENTPVGVWQDVDDVAAIGYGFQAGVFHQGGFTWDIPYEWKPDNKPVTNTNVRYFGNIDQLFTLDKVARSAAVFKAGMGGVRVAQP